jgi:hypothetical protein
MVSESLEHKIVEIEKWIKNNNSLPEKIGNLNDCIETKQLFSTDYQRKKFCEKELLL